MLWCKYYYQYLISIFLIFWIFIFQNWHFFFCRFSVLSKCVTRGCFTLWCTVVDNQFIIIHNLITTLPYFCDDEVNIFVDIQWNFWQYPYMYRTINKWINYQSLYWLRNKKKNQWIGLNFTLLIYLCLSVIFNRSTWDVTAICNGSWNGLETKMSKSSSPQLVGFPKTWRVFPLRASRRKTCIVVSITIECRLNVHWASLHPL